MKKIIALGLFLSFSFQQATWAKVTENCTPEVRDGLRPRAAGERGTATAYEKPAWFTDSDESRLRQAMESLKPFVGEIIGTVPVQSMILYHKLYGFEGRIRLSSLQKIWEEADDIEKSQSFDWKRLVYEYGIIMGKSLYCHYEYPDKGYWDQGLPVFSISFRGTTLNTQKHEKIKDQIRIVIRQLYGDLKKDDEQFVFLEAWFFDSLCALFNIDSIVISDQVGIKNPFSISAISIVNRSDKPQSTLPTTAPMRGVPALFVWPRHVLEGILRPLAAGEDNRI